MSLWLARGLRTIARGLALFGLWMVFVDNLHEAEIVTGIVVAAAGAPLWTLVQESRHEPVRLRAAMLRHAHRLVWLLFADTARITVALVWHLLGRRPLSGRLRAVRYRATSDEAEDRTRRILTEWGTSLAANRYAIGIDVEHEYLLIHELVPSPGPLDPMGLG